MEEEKACDPGGVTKKVEGSCLVEKKFSIAGPNL